MARESARESAGELARDSARGSAGELARDSARGSARAQSNRARNRGAVAPRRSRLHLRAREQPWRHMAGKRHLAAPVVLALAGVTLALAAPSARAQTDSAKGPAVGEMAPDFSLPGATRYGLLEKPVRLSDYRGKTVVLAFFFKSRTKG